MSEFKCANGAVYIIPDKSCVTCKHCTDVLWDFTNGPYCFICNEDHPNADGMNGDCKFWEEEE